MIKIHQHHLTEFLSCQMRFHLSENLCLVPRISKKYLDLGQAFHLGTAIWKKTFNKELAMTNVNQYFNNIIPENQSEQNEFDKVYAIAQAMLIGYFDRYKTDHGYLFIEKKLACSFNKFQLVGTPDAILKDNGYWLQEEKTTSRLEEDYVTRLPLDFQVTFYFYMAQKSLHKKFSGIDYRITRIPQIRLKQKQTKEQYLNELSMEYINRPEHYFVNERLYRSEDDLKIFETELEQQIKDLMNCYKTNNWYRNTAICKKINCWYEKYCVTMNPNDLEIFYKRRDDLNKCFSIINKMEVT